MAKGKLILICQSGGEFVTNDDGTMSYNGGEATAANVTSETPFNDLKLNLAETCNLDQETMTVKYFLPGNKRNLITLKNDKDVKRMIDFHGDAITAEVFVAGTPGFDRSAVDMQTNRQSVTKNDEAVNNDNVRTKKDEMVKQGKVFAKKDNKMKEEHKVPKSPYASPAKRTRRAVAAANAEASFDKNAEGNTNALVSEDAKSEGSTRDTSTSASSEHVNENADSDFSSDYVPSRYAKRKKRNSRSETNANASPADTVKKRRRTPSWKFGANGRPTIVTVPDDDSVRFKSRKSQGKSGKAIDENSGGRKSQRKSSRLAAKGDSSRETKSGRKRGRPRAIVAVADSGDQELDDFVESSPLAICNDDASPETLVASWKSAITGVGQEFTSVYEFQEALQKYAIANRFAYKFKKNDTSRAIGGCAAEGCSWKFIAVWVENTQSFKIKTLNNVHTCDKESRKSAYPTEKWLVNTIKERLQDSPHLKPKEIANGLLRDFGVDLDYTQVWRGIGVAREQLHGSHKEAYNKLPRFCEKIVETNPGSISKLLVGENKIFKALFVSFYASLCGFQNGCRPLLFLEATSLRSKYGEVLLTANAIDGNDGFFPVAFAIVDVEDDNNWHWFLEQLKAAILNSQPITFVFDREKNLKTSVLEVFENAHVGYSIYHLLESFKRNVKGPFHGDGKAFLPVHFLAAAHAVRLVGFRKSAEQIKQISSQAYDWVMQIEAQHWTTSSFKGERYNHITDDVGRPFAKLMEDYHELPILHKIDTLICTMIDAISDAKLDASMWSSQLTPSKEKKLQEENLKAHGLKVLISSDTLFEVREDSTHVVNTSNWSCTCLGWKETGLPCRHALAVFALIGKNPYEFCSNYFTVDAYRLTYTESITAVPITGEKEQVIEEEGEKIEIEEEKGEKIGTKKAEGEKEEAGEKEAEKEEGEKDEVREEVEKEKGEKIEMEKAGGEDEETGKAEGEEIKFLKEEGKKGKVREEDEDSNVLVLPPIPAKPAAVEEEKMEWDETEGETKRTVTCTKCKQPGHNKKSCNLYQLQQAC